MFVCFHVLIGDLLWCGGLLWLVISALVYRCDLMLKLIKLHTRGCVGGQIRLAGCVSIGEYVAQVTLLVWGWVGWMARGLFGDEIAVFVEGMYVELFICC